MVRVRYLTQQMTGMHVPYGDFSLGIASKYKDGGRKSGAVVNDRNAADGIDVRVYLWREWW